MHNSKTIVIADDHALIRNGLRQILESNTSYSIFEASNGQEALELIKKEHPALAILDVEMPEVTGFDVAKKIRAQGINIDIIFLTMYKDESMFNQAMDIGVKGYVLKENTVNEIIQCLKSVIAGRHYISPAISDLLLKRNAKLSAPASDKDGLHLLTESENNIMKLLSQMKTSQEIATELGISVKTVQNHRNNICGKLDLRGSHSLLKFAIDHSDQL